MTSAVPNEGKSTVATNFAVTFSLAGSRVLLVDGDMRRGEVHRSFGLGNNCGLSDVLSGRVALTEALQQTSIPNLTLLSRGRGVPNPGELYLSQSADEFLQNVYTDFDYVIIDSSPVMAADDTTSFAPKAEATIFVFRFTSSSTRASRKALSLLEERMTNVIGMVCNDVSDAMQEYYQYRYRGLRHEARWRPGEGLTWHGASGSLPALGLARMVRILPANCSSRKVTKSHGMVRRTALEVPEQRLGRIRHLLDDLKLHSGSLDSFASLFKILNKVRPDECYHLAASSFVSYSFEDEFATLHTNVDSIHYLLSAVHDCTPGCRVYFAGTSEMFGAARETPQHERTAFVPPEHLRHFQGGRLRSGAETTAPATSSTPAVAFSTITKVHGVRRSLSRKRSSPARRESARVSHPTCPLVTSMPAAIGATPRITCGPCGSCCNATNRRDFVIATGKTHTVRDLCARAFARLGLDWQKHVRSDDRLFRESEEIELRGDASRARQVLGWTPAYDFDALVNEMTDAALAATGEKNVRS